MLLEEILAPSTAATDRLAKTALYARFGIPEYWIVDPDSMRVDAYTLTERTYVPIVDDGLARCVLESSRLHAKSGSGIWRG